MARKEGQKLKLIKLKEIFTRYTDQDHPLSVPQLVDRLEKEGIQAERKSLYDDIEALQALGCNIELQRGRGGGYYLAEGEFQMAELKMLVDAIQASRFITKRKSNMLIEKLEKFTSVYQENQLRRQVLVSGRIKSTEESIYYNVDALHRAIDQGCQITFKYRNWNMDKRLVERKDGAAYRVSPWALVWESGNYYLVAYNAEEQRLRHFRVDKMAKVNLLENKPREGAAAYREFNVTTYVQQTFGMFGGTETKVTLRCENKMVGAMIDRFGTDPILVPQEDGEHFHMTVTVQTSPQFYGWVAGFNGAVEVIGPEKARAEMAETVKKLYEQYK